MAPSISNYASSGPLGDKEMNPPQDPAPSALEASEPSTLGEKFEGLKLEDCNSSTRDCNSGLGGSDDKTAESAASEDQQQRKGDSLKKSTHEPNSLPFSLEKFCAPEYLTGDNKFACAVCTKELAEKRAAQTEDRSDSPAVGGSEEPHCDEQPGEIEKTDSMDIAGRNEPECCDDNAQTDTEKDKTCEEEADQEEAGESDHEDAENGAEEDNCSEHSLEKKG